MSVRSISGMPPVTRRTPLPDGSPQMLSSVEPLADGLGQQVRARGEDLPELGREGPRALEHARERVAEDLPVDVVAPLAHEDA